MTAPQHAAPKPHRDRMPYVFFGAMAVGLAGNCIAQVDLDAGGYRDEWNTRASFPD